MPEWRFLVTRHFGTANQRRLTCESIKRQVEQRGLSKVLPLVKYELGRCGEYYLGVAVDSNAIVDGIDAEEVARQVLVQSGIHGAGNREVSPLCEAERVRGLLRGNLQCASFTIPFQYEESGDWDAQPSDLHLAELDISVGHREPDETEGEQYERLLQWCSAIGAGGLDRIRQACERLGINNEWGGAWSVLRRLVLLGHTEFDGGASLRWGVIPPTLVTFEDDVDSSYLAGQRTPAIVQRLRERLDLREYKQPNGPSRLVVQGPTGEMGYGFGRRLNEVGCVSRIISELIPSVDRWIKNLPIWDERDFGRFKTEKYDPQSDVFGQAQAVGVNPQPGLYRFTGEYSGRKIVTVAFLDDRDRRWICGDYYGLRFIARSRCGLCQSGYFTDSHQLIIPITDRWPMPYERSLVLASGLLPRKKWVNGQTFLVYECLSQEYAMKMHNLVGLKMECH